MPEIRCGEKSELRFFSGASDADGEGVIFNVNSHFLAARLAELHLHGEKAERHIAGGVERSLHTICLGKHYQTLVAEQARRFIRLETVKMHVHSMFTTHQHIVSTLHPSI